MIQLLAPLPSDHPLRRQPLAGAWFRTFAWGGEDISIPPEKRGPDWRKREWGNWRQVLPTWKIANKSYNDLGSTWTNNTEWTFDHD